MVVGAEAGATGLIHADRSTHPGIATAAASRMVRRHAPMPHGPSTTGDVPFPRTGMAMRRWLLPSLALAAYIGVYALVRHHALVREQHDLPMGAGIDDGSSILIMSQRLDTSRLADAPPARLVARVLLWPGWRIEAWWRADPWFTLDRPIIPRMP